MTKHQNDRHYVQTYFPLLLWAALGAVLRLTNLALKPAASIEIATIGYSLGHGFQTIALDRLISRSDLLAPLRLETTIPYIEVFRRLVAESTHPPLYFWLTHWWANLWLNNGDLMSLFTARSLSAFFGVLTILAIYVLARVAFKSRSVAHFSAALMAVSPYGIYLAQEARHYTLTVFWVIISLTCLMQTLRLLRSKQRVPLWLSLAWIAVNALGIATHYFFVLALAAEAIAVLLSWLFARGKFKSYFKGLFLAGIGTFTSGLIWLPIVRGVAGNEMTTWIATSYGLQDLLLPPIRLFVWMITMVMLLPVEGVAKPIAIASGVVLLVILCWMLPTWIKYWRKELASSNRPATILLMGYLGGSLAIFLVLIYGMGKDLSLAARYHFVYFPGVILLVAVALSACWTKVRKKVWVLLAIALLGSLTVVNNLGFQKSLASDRLATHILQQSNLPTIVAKTHKTHSEIRELVALALSFQRLSPDPTQLPQFILVSSGNTTLSKILATQPKPLNLFGIDLELDDAELDRVGCRRNTEIDLQKSGYRDLFYLCQ